MSYSTTQFPYTPFFSPGPTSKKKGPNRDAGPFGEEPPQKPDWLLIFMAILFLLTLLLLWIVDIPSLLKE